MRSAGGSDVHVRRMRRCGGCERYEKRITGRRAGGSKPRGGTERAGASAPLHWRQPRVPETPTEGNAGNGTRLAHSKSKEDTRGGFHECIAEHCPQLTHCSAMRRKPWSRVKPSVLRITSPKPPARLAMIHPSAQNYYHRTTDDPSQSHKRQLCTFLLNSIGANRNDQKRVLTENVLLIYLHVICLFQYLDIDKTAI